MHLRFFYIHSGSPCEIQCESYVNGCIKKENMCDAESDCKNKEDEKDCGNFDIFKKIRY